MGIRRTMTAGGLVVALVIGSASCGKAAEEIAEQASGCENIDASGDEVSAECDGISAGVDAEGNASVTNENGESVEISGQGEASLPEGWPSELTLPADAKIVTSAASQNPLTYVVNAGTDGDVAAVTEDIKAQLTAAGYTIDSESDATAGAGATSTLSASGTEFDTSVTVSAAPATTGTDAGATIINWTLTETQG